MQHLQSAEHGCPKNLAGGEEKDPGRHHLCDFCHSTLWGSLFGVPIKALGLGWSREKILVAGWVDPYPPFGCPRALNPFLTQDCSLNPT